MANSLFLLIGLGIIAWFWFDTLQSREIAKTICKQTCGQQKLQLLDDTIVLKNMRLKRNHQGRLKVQRAYQFEFSENGSNTRQRGMVIMCGTVLEILELPGYLNRTISPV